MHWGGKAGVSFDKLKVVLMRFLHSIQLHTFYFLP